MKKIIFPVAILLFLVVVTGNAFGQAKPPVKKSSSTKTTPKRSSDEVKEEIPPEVVRIGTLDSSGNQSLPDVPLPALNFDTTSAPNDAFTKEILLLLEETGAMNLGLMMAKGLEDKKATEQAPLMKEFYDRLYKEMGSGYINKYLVNENVKAYRKFFTQEEVGQLRQFYKTPVGVKTIKVLPELMQGIMEYGKTVGGYYGQKIMHELLLEEKKKSN